MGRNRVLSFMSQLSASYKDSRSSSPSPPPEGLSSNGASSLNGLKQETQESRHEKQDLHDTAHDSRHLKQHTPPSSTEQFPPVPCSPVRPDYASGDSRFDHTPTNGSPTTGPYGRNRSSSRPLSIVQTYHPHMMDVNDTIPELQPIFTYLNSNGNKLYQEGYFLKLDDQNTHGRPNPDRSWTECFAQLVGTVLSLWDAAELDAAGDDGEVLPKFINLTDASIKMIDSLPTRTAAEQPLQNILSVSTAGRNRYLLHFNSQQSLIQWTSSIRLAMFEQASLQESYTGALIAGKGRSVNNINIIMDRSRFKTEEWVRVRFGAGVPWRRCWCVISPPDEKEMAKLQKSQKKRSPYDRSHMPTLKGNIKFYDIRKEGKKQKKVQPIATLTDAYSAYAIYPQSKALIDASTLIKVEGTIAIHSDPPSTTEGFVFIMPEINPAVTGFEMLLRFLFPTWDTFGLYGRPGRLVASVLDPRSLMFAMPRHRRYGYLDVSDVATLVTAEANTSWSECEWRKKLKEATGQRMTAAEEEANNGTTTSRRASNRSNKRLSFGLSGSQNASPADRHLPPRSKVGFADDSESGRSSRSTTPAIKPALRNGSVPPSDRQVIPGGDVNGSFSSASSPQARFVNDLSSTPERVSSDDENSPGSGTPPGRDLAAMARRMETPEPVHAPPAFNHAPSSRPTAAPYHSADMRRANTRLSHSTLAQITGQAPAELDSQASFVSPAAAAAAAAALGGNQSRSQNPLPPTQPLAPAPDYLNQPRPSSAGGQNTNRGPQPNGPGPQSRPQQAGLQLNTANLGPQRPPQNGGRSPVRGPGQGPMPPQGAFQPQRPRTPTAQAGPNGAPQPAQLQTSPPIHRKPLPPNEETSRAAKYASGPNSASTAGSVTAYIIEASALDQAHYNDHEGMQPAYRLKSNQSDERSLYEDASSTLRGNPMGSPHGARPPFGAPGDPGVAMGIPHRKPMPDGQQPMSPGYYVPSNGPWRPGMPDGRPGTSDERPGPMSGSMPPYALRGNNASSPSLSNSYNQLSPPANMQDMRPSSQGSGASGPGPRGQPGPNGQAMYGNGGRQQMPNGYPMSSPRGPPQQQRAPMGPPQQGANGPMQSPGWGRQMPGAWPMRQGQMGGPAPGQMQGPAQGQYMTGGNAPQGRPYSPGQFAGPVPNAMGPPRQVNPAAINQGALYPGRAF